MQHHKGSGKQKPREIRINDILYGKMAPQSSELETAVLGAMLLEPGCIDTILEIITDHETFYSDANQRIYLAILAMYKRGSSIDFMTVCDQLRKAGELEMVGGSYYVSGLTRDVVSSAHVEEHARIVLQKYILRECIRSCGTTIAEAYESGADALEVLDNLGKFSIEIMEKIIRRQYEHVSRPLNKLLIETIELCERKEKLTGITTGFKELDNITGGWQRTDFIIIAARPSVGKTAFAMQLIYNAVRPAYNDPDIEVKGVALFSLEMSKSQILQRLVANVANLQLAAIKKGRLSLQELEHMRATIERINKLPIFIDDHAGLTMLELRAKARRLKKKDNIGLIIVDYLQIMGTEGNVGNREQELSMLSREIKKLAKEIDIPIIALSQLNRSIDSRANKSPVLSDLRESGAIEQDADLVIFLYGNGEDVIKKQPHRINERHVKVAKHRSGRTADLVYDFVGDYQRFENEDVTVIDIPHEDIFIKPAEIRVIKNAAEPLEPTRIDGPSNLDDLPF